jgi:hypothetical protein
VHSLSTQRGSLAERERRSLSQAMHSRCKFHEPLKYHEIVTEVRQAGTVLFVPASLIVESELQVIADLAEHCVPLRTTRLQYGM